MRKNEVVLKTIEPAIEFIKRIKPKERVVIVHDEDCDGVCSGSIIAKLIKNLLNQEPKLFSTEWNVSLTEKVVKEVLRERPKHVIFLDIPEIPKDLLKKIKANILIIDHHPLEKYGKVTYCNPRKYEKEIYIPTSYLAYKLCESFGIKNTIWIAAVGILADHGIENCKDLFKDLRESYYELIGRVKLAEKDLFKNSLLALLTEIIDSGRVVKGKEGAEFVSRYLLKVENYEEVLKGMAKEARVMLRWSKKVEKEFEKLLKDFRRKNKLIGKIFLFYKFDSKLKLKSTLASALWEEYDDKIIVIGQMVGKYFDLSLRRGKNVKVHLGSLIKKIIKKIPNSSGGGHPSAAAARIPNKYLKIFLESLSKF